MSAAAASSRPVDSRVRNEGRMQGQNRPLQKVIELLGEPFWVYFAESTPCQNVCSFSHNQRVRRKSMKKGSYLIISTPTFELEPQGSGVVPGAEVGLNEQHLQTHRRRNRQTDGRTD